MSSCSLEYLGIPPLILPKIPVNCVNPVIPPENRKEILLAKCKSFFDEKNEIDSLKNMIDKLKKGVEGVNKLYANNRVGIDRISQNTEELKTLNRKIEEEFNQTLKYDKILEGQQYEIKEQHREIEEQHQEITEQHREIEEQLKEITEGLQERARLDEEIEAGFCRIKEGIKKVGSEQEKTISDQMKMLQEVDKMILEMEEFNQKLKGQEAERALLENKKNVTNPVVEEEFKESLEVNIPKNIAVPAEISNPEICDEDQTLTEKPFEKEKETEGDDAKEMDFLADELIADLNKGIEQKSDEVMVPLEESPSLKKTLFFFITAPLYLGLFIAQGLKIVFFLADKIYSRIGKLILWK